MNKYETYLVGKKAAGPRVIPGFKAGMLYCHRCAKALWPSIDPEDTDLSYFRAGGVYLLLPEERNAMLHRGELPQCGHDI